MIYADDLGYGDLACYGSRLSTPNLDRMAAEGVRFTQFYSANPVCSPSRAALLTGRYPTRAGVPRVLFPTDTVGLPDSDDHHRAGVKTTRIPAMCVGKWHLGHHCALPAHNRRLRRVLRHSLQQRYGGPGLCSTTPKWAKRKPRSKPSLRAIPSRPCTSSSVERARHSSFICRHTYPHIPLAASPRFRGKVSSGIYGDVIAEMDWSVGEVAGRAEEEWPGQ
jgi:arylsulfatase